MSTSTAAAQQVLRTEDEDELAFDFFPIKSQWSDLLCPTDLSREEAKRNWTPNTGAFEFYPSNKGSASTIRLNIASDSEDPVTFNVNADGTVDLKDFDSWSEESAKGSSKSSSPKSLDSRSKLAGSTSQAFYPDPRRARAEQEYAYMRQQWLLAEHMRQQWYQQQAGFMPAY